MQSRRTCGMSVIEYVHFTRDILFQHPRHPSAPPPPRTHKPHTHPSTASSSVVCCFCAIPPPPRIHVVLMVVPRACCVVDVVITTAYGIGFVADHDNRHHCSFTVPDIQIPKDDRAVMISLHLYQLFGGSLLRLISLYP